MVKLYYIKGVHGVKKIFFAKFTGKHVGVTF